MINIAIPKSLSSYFLVSTISELADKLYTHHDALAADLKVGESEYQRV